MTTVIDDHTGYTFKLMFDGKPSSIKVIRHDITKPFIYAAEIRIMCFQFFGLMRVSDFDSFDCYEVDEYKHRNYIEEKGDRHI